MGANVIFYQTSEVERNAFVDVSGQLFKNLLVGRS